MRPHSLPAESHSFVGMARETAAMPPALLEREKKKERKKEKFYIYLDVTHTRPEPGQPWKARGRKKRTQTTGKRPKQRRGGRERTNLQNQPTRRNDLTKTEHTPKSHNTLRRGTGGKKELGTKWGTSWWRVWKTKTINLNKDSAPLNLKVERCSLTGTVVRSAPGA